MSKKPQYDCFTNLPPGAPEPDKWEVRHYPPMEPGGKEWFVVRGPNRHGGFVHFCYNRGEAEAIRDALEAYYAGKK